MAMTAPYRTLLAPGLVLVLFGAGYIFAPRPDAAPSAASAPRAVAVTAATIPAAPIVAAMPGRSDRCSDDCRAHRETVRDAGSGPCAGPAGASHTIRITRRSNPTQPSRPCRPRQPPGGAGTDGALPPPSDETKAGGDSEAKAAIELDGYKNVRALVKGPDGLWRGRAMRGRTEITVRVDATGNVSAE